MTVFKVFITILLFTLLSYNCGHCESLYQPLTELENSDAVSEIQNTETTATESFEINKNNEDAEAGNRQERKPLDSTVFYIFFHGVLWVQILYSLLSFLITKERTSLYYGLFMFGLSLFFMMIMDLRALGHLFKLPASIGKALFKGSAFIVVFALLKFAYEYLDVRRILPRFKKLTFYFLLLFVAVEVVEFGTIFNLFGSDNKVLSIALNCSLLLFFMVGGFSPFIWAISTWIKGYKPAKYFLLAMFFAGAAMTMLVVTFWQNRNSDGMPLVFIQSLLLLTVIALGLADGYRVNLFKKDKERADRLNALDIAKTRLYTNITHEFRTPLTVILGAAGQISGNETEKQLINRNSEQLLQLINQMLDLSKLEGGALTLNPQQGNIIPFLEYLVESFQSMADIKNIRLTFYREVEELQMDYDLEKLQRVVTNLLSNALKFTDESGKIVVHVKTETFKKSSHLSISVRDNGVGIVEGEISHVFDRFYQADASDMRNSEGSGIGLALVKELVQLMRGEINVQSKVNEGSVFTVRIPITNEAPFQTSNNEHISTLDESKEVETSLLPTINREDLPLALIIEDNKDIVSFLRTCLQTKYKIEVAHDGTSGIVKAFDIIPDVIISDVMMPKTDGYTVCKTIKEDERTSHIPVIMLTAKVTQEDKERGLEVGADAYLTKPFHQKELEVRLEKLIALRRELQNRYQNNSNSILVDPVEEDEFIQKIRSIVEENIENESFGILELCRSIGLSRMQVHRKIKALTGKPTTHLIHQIRLQRAHHLLTSTNLNISEIAYKVGFSDHSYFTKLFAQHFDQTPTEVATSKE